MIFRSHFNRATGSRYFYKKTNGRYEVVDGERKAWDLQTCIRKYGRLEEPVKANLEFFVRLRNRIEHRSVTGRELDTLIFGECQALLYNYESQLVDFFGEKYALHENLMYSLQFSRVRTAEQLKAARTAQSRDFRDITRYIETYRSSLTNEVFNSQKFSIKLIQIPRISNTNRSDLAVQFVGWDDLSSEDRDAYDRLVTIIKEKSTLREAINVSRYRPKDVRRMVEERTGLVLSNHDHVCLYTVFGIRPSRSSRVDPSHTNPKYCLYDTLHNDYLYEQRWVDVIVNVFLSERLSRLTLKGKFKRNERLKPDDFETPAA